ncbi:MAG: DNA-binding protein [Methylorubrum populi]
MAFSFNDTARLWRRTPSAPLVRRDDNLLPFVGERAEAGQSLSLDTCVYIDELQEKTPPTIADLIAVRQVNHSAVAVQELMYAVGALDPADPRSRPVVDKIGRMIEGMPRHRLYTPDAEVLAKGAVYAGMLSRNQNYSRDDRRRALNDCVLFLQAIKLGCTVLTRNIRDFDFLLQMCPAGRVLFYRV